MMPADRSSRQLTNYVPPGMARPNAPLPEKRGIFGDTYNGVPNPVVPHKHPWPTRYHGPVFIYPQPGYQYMERPYAEAPFSGLGASLFGAKSSFTGSQLIDAFIGAALGYVAAPSKDKAVIHAVAGGASGAFLGSAGLILFLAGEILLQHKKESRREDVFSRFRAND